MKSRLFTEKQANTIAKFISTNCTNILAACEKLSRKFGRKFTAKQIHSFYYRALRGDAVKFCFYSFDTKEGEGVKGFKDGVKNEYRKSKKRSRK